MKKKLIYFLFFLAGGTGYGQSSQPASIQGELTDIANFSSQQTGYERFQSYKGATSGSQFFTDGWVKGSVISADNKTIGGNYTLLYDKVRQLLFAKAMNTDNAGLVAYNKIRSFSIESDGTHQFVNASLYDSTDNTDFYEVLAQGKNATLLKLTKTTFELADRTSSTGVWQGKLTDAYIDHYTYFLYHDGKLEKIALKENSFRKALKAYSGQVTDYAAAHYGDATDENYFKHLVESINS